MVVQVYCTAADVEAIWSPAAVLRCVDDDGDGVLSADEQARLTRALERAANKMNAALEMRYSLAQLAGNAWCRDCNAALAAYLLATRRGNAAPDHLQEQYESYARDLDEIRAGRLKAPQVADTQEALPTVTNFAVDARPPRAKARRVDETSTGQPPPPGRKRFPADD